MTSLTSEQIAASVALTKNQNRLEHEESQMKKNLREYAESLKSIRDSGCWEVHGRPYESFNDYCRKKLGFSSARASQIICATDTLKSLSDASSGDSVASEALLGLKEGSLRELRDVEPEFAVEIVKEVAASGKVTAAKIREKVKPNEVRNVGPSKESRLEELFAQSEFNVFNADLEARLIKRILEICK